MRQDTLSYTHKSIQSHSSNAPVRHYLHTRRWLSLDPLGGRLLSLSTALPCSSPMNNIAATTTTASGTTSVRTPHPLRQLGHYRRLHTCFLLQLLQIAQEECRPLLFLVDQWVLVVDVTRRCSKGTGGDAQWHWEGGEHFPEGQLRLVYGIRLGVLKQQQRCCRRSEPSALDALEVDGANDDPNALPVRPLRHLQPLTRHDSARLLLKYAECLQQ
mmetsp:Transcript_20733/g.50584  ORF Transcript_20733/g.50584 Transcript_20733/m.50584 type:complete len:215 (+) Transcript_20733:2275-2919(+)